MARGGDTATERGVSPIDEVSRSHQEELRSHRAEQVLGLSRTPDLEVSAYKLSGGEESEAGLAGRCRPIPRVRIYLYGLTWCFAAVA
jgi:hypothetical protein